MADTTAPSQTPAEMQNPAVEASYHANAISEDGQARDSPMEGDTTRCVYCDRPNNLPETLECELLRKTALLERYEGVMVEENEVIETLRSLAQDLEHQLSQSERQTRDIYARYGQQRAHLIYLIRCLFRDREAKLFLRDQMTEAEQSTAALTEELHRKTEELDSKTAIIQKLKEQMHNASAILHEITSSMRDARSGAPSQSQENPVGEGPSQHPDDHEEPPAHSSQATQTPYDTPSATPVQPISSVPEPPAPNYSPFTTLFSSIPTWVWYLLLLLPTATRDTDIHKEQHHPKPSSPESKARGKRRTTYQSSAVTKAQLKSRMLSAAAAEQSIKSAAFLALRKMQQQEEQQWFGKGVQPMTRTSTVEEASTHENTEAYL